MSTVYKAIEEGRLTDAIEELQALDQESLPVLSVLGYCHYHSANYEAAAEVYGKLAKLDKKYVQSLGLSLSKCGLYEEAFRVWGPYQVGCLLYKQGNFVEALEMFTEAGDTLDAIYNRALC
jgi:tetratricopeptide (TPR) repeat protein